MNYKDPLSALDFRIETISDLKSSLSLNINEDKKGIYKKYYIEIAYFVHSIYQNEELSFLFDELLSYSSKLSLNHEYTEIIIKIRNLIKSIAHRILSDEKFNEFEQNDNSGWVNPISETPMSLEVKTLLEYLENIDKYKLRLSYNDIYSLLYNTDGLNGIINRFFRIATSSYDDIINELNLFDENLRNLSFHSKFLHDFLGVNSALHLQRIYKALHPLITTSDFNEKIINGYIGSGESLVETNNLLIHCKKVREYFKQKLVAKFSIDFSIIKFKHYMEIFHNDDDSKYSEIYFQKKFELFMFNNGYFALSQGQIGNGRYDDIILTENNAFIFEHKQIGFNKQEETTASCFAKFKKGKIQTKIYHERLRLLPGLSNDVYIIIFSKYYLRFIDNISDIYREGLNFRFRLICLEKSLPTKTKHIFEVDIKELFK